MGQHAYKNLTMPKNHRFMPKIARKTHNFEFFHLFLVYLFPKTGPRPIFFPLPPAPIFWSIYIPVWHPHWRQLSSTISQSLDLMLLHSTSINTKNQPKIRHRIESNNIIQNSVIQVLKPQLLNWQESLSYFFFLISGRRGCFPNLWHHSVYLEKSKHFQIFTILHKFTVFKLSIVILELQIKTKRPNGLLLVLLK